MNSPDLTSFNIDPASLAALPRTCGMYIFRGSGVLPLYIGKSVNIRSRVMSHLRNPEEQRMLAQTRRVDFIETAGEIGALLLESHMVKAQSPLFNQRLRRIRSLCSIRLSSTGQGLKPEIVSSKSVKLGATPELYGLFASQHAATTKLKELAQDHLLCLSTLGLEKTSKRGCFGLQIKTCLGTCIGKEDRHLHDQRLLSALTDSQVQVWPFQGPVDVIEESDGWVQRHRVHNWCYLGTQCSKNNSASLQSSTYPQDPEFDLDSYKILVKPIMLGSVRVEACQTNGTPVLA
jgi:excinuclease Cho